VSQFSREEIKERDELKKLTEQVAKQCDIEEEYEFVVVESVDWGLICRQSNGYLEAAIIGKKELSIGDVFIGRIIEKTSSGNPIIEINSTQLKRTK
jgi:hypothetical protein